VSTNYLLDSSLSGSISRGPCRLQKARKRDKPDSTRQKMMVTLSDQTSCEVTSPTDLREEPRIKAITDRASRQHGKTDIFVKGVADEGIKCCLRI
jgi:hypothetical protein